LRYVFTEILSGLLDPGKQAPADGSSEIKEAIRNELNENGLLEDQTLIENRKALNKAKNYEEFLQKEINYYKDLEAKGFVIVDSWHYNGLKNSLKDISVKISELESDLSVAEEETIITEEDLVEEDIEEEVIIEEEEPDSEEASPETEVEEPTQEVEEVEAAKGTVTLNGTMGADSFTMSMTINLDTGAVSGMVYVRIYFTDFDYQLEENVPISGTMDLETRSINAQAGDGRLTGKLSADGNSASGTMSSDDGSVAWSVSR